MSHKVTHWLTSLITALTISFAGLTPAMAAPPANDNFADAEAITSLPFSTTVDITEAGLEQDEPQYCTSMGNTVWFSFSPIETMLVRAHTEGSVIANHLSVYRATGSSISDLEFLSCSFYYPGVFLAEAGQTYYLQAGAQYEVGTIQINLEQVFPPVNDNFADAEGIASLPFSATVDITGAGIEPDEPSGCNSRERTVWYSFTPTETMLIGVDTQGSSIGSLLHLYSASGPGFSGLNLLQCPFADFAFSFVAEAGQTYYLQVGSNQVGTIQVNVNQLFPPLNDNFANAEAISSLPFNTAVDITDARTEPGEPLHWCTPMDRTVWYSFTPTETAIVRVDTQGSSINSNLNIYQAFGPGIGGLNILSCTAIYGPFTFVAEAGQTYYFQAGGMNGEVGTVRINLEQVPPPANDDFANATPINSFPSTMEVTNIGSTVEGNEPHPTCAGSPSHTVWFTFTPSQDGSISSSITNNTFNAFWAVYSGTNLNNLTELGCKYYGRLTFHAVAGQTYYFQVGSPSEGMGTGTLSLEVPPPPQAGFYFNPLDPSKFDIIQFYDGSYDPAEAGIQTQEWDFGDGSTASGYSSSHKYAADGEYPVTLTVTTFDGRTASIVQTVQVRTHDVSITKVAAPKSVSTGQTRTIRVSVRNSAYPEMVQVDLYRSTPGGFELIDTLPLPVPASSGNRTTSFSFNYTFTSQDAQIGKVTFRAVAIILNARDAWPNDNEAISSPPTKVAR